MQLARHHGATVTAVTGPTNARLVSDLGAAQVLDHTQVDLATLADRFDVVLDAVGNLSLAAGRRLLTCGVLLMVAAAITHLRRARPRSSG